MTDEQLAVYLSRIVSQLLLTLNAVNKNLVEMPGIERSGDDGIAVVLDPLYRIVDELNHDVDTLIGDDDD